VDGCRLLSTPNQACVVSPDGQRWIISHEATVLVTRRKIPTRVRLWTLRRRVLGCIRTVGRNVGHAEALAFLEGNTEPPSKPPPKPIIVQPV
jgi:hypothetical protein